MKILVTGGAGYIGSHTVVELVNNGHEPIIIDDFRNSEKSVLIQLEKITGTSILSFDVDCNDFDRMDAVFQQTQPEGIIHFAADKAVGESVENPLKYYHNNVGSLVTVLRLSEKHNVNQFVFSSSCTVYGEPDQTKVDEGSIVKPATSPYGNTKQICEQIIIDYSNKNKSFKPVILRYFNPIGAHPSALIGELPLGSPNNLVPYLTQTVAGIREQLTVFGGDYPTDDGTCIRDYIHVSDLANAHVLSFNKMETDVPYPLTYNVGTGTGHSVLDVISQFEKITGKKVNYHIGNRRAGDVVAVFADNQKILEELNWKPVFSLGDALLHAWKWQETLAAN